MPNESSLKTQDDPGQELPDFEEVSEVPENLIPIAFKSLADVGCRAVEEEFAKSKVRYRQFSQRRLVTDFDTDTWQKTARISNMQPVSSAEEADSNVDDSASDPIKNDGDLSTTIDAEISEEQADAANFCTAVCKETTDVDPRNCFRNSLSFARDMEPQFIPFK